MIQMVKHQFPTLKLQNPAKLKEGMEKVNENFFFSLLNPNTF